MQGLVLLLVFFGTALLVLGTYALINRRRLNAAAMLRQRMGEDEPTVAPMGSILRDLRRSSLPALDRLLDSMAVSEALDYELRRAGASWSVGEFVLGSAIAASFLLLIGEQWGLLTAWLGALIGAVAPFIVVRQMQKRRAKKFEDQLPDAIDMIVNAMRAGFSFQAALKFVGEEVPTPLGEEFTRVYDEQRLGADTRVALLSMQERVGTLDAKMFVTSLLIQRETGGNLSEVLSGLATLVRDRGALRGQVDTLTAEPKFAGRVLALLPVVGFFALLYLNRPMMIPMLTTTTGRYILLYAAGSIAVGYFVLMKIADIEL
jgi:tight adherence protein B